MTYHQRQKISLSRLPSLNALRAFVVASRHMNFIGAAAELHVSPTAVGQQIRQLEEWLGVPVFERHRGTLKLTRMGDHLSGGLTEAFAKIQETISTASEVTQEARLRVMVPPSFAARWLMPRMEEFHRQMGRVKIEIVVAPSSVAPEDSEVDFAIRFSSGQHPGLHAEALMGEELIALCSPDFARRHDLDRLGPAALAHVPLIHFSGADHDEGAPDWEKWLDRFGPGVSRSAGASDIHFGQASLLLDAAAAGAGICLGKRQLARADLAAGRLIVPFGTPWPLTWAYHFVAPPHSLHSLAVGAALSWLRQACAGDAQNTAAA